MKELRITSCQAENSYSACRTITRHIGETLSVPTEFVDKEPWQDRINALAEGQIQVGWICGTWYVNMQNGTQPTVRLLAAPVPQADRYEHQPRYFSDVVVRSDSEFLTFSDLRGSHWAYNEPGSHSGYNVVRYHLATVEAYSDYFAEVSEVGSHHKALQMILAGHVDAAAIDSLMLDIALDSRSTLRNKIRVIETLGPSPMPPWVISNSVSASTQDAIREALLHLHEDKKGREALHDAGLASFKVVDDSDYHPIRQMMSLAQLVTL